MKWTHSVLLRVLKVMQKVPQTCAFYCAVNWYSTTEIFLYSADYCWMDSL